MFDAILFERAGVPAVAIVTSPFASTAEYLAEMQGMAGFAYAEVPHPITSLTMDEVRERARLATPQIEAILLGR